MEVEELTILVSNGINLHVCLWIITTLHIQTKLDCFVFILAGSQWLMCQDLDPINGPNI
jgi:hypothetical protein